MPAQHPENLFELTKLLNEQGVPKDEHWRFIGQFIESKCRRLHIPKRGNFELTPFCNLNCKMCYVHLVGEHFSSSPLLSVEQWKSLAVNAIEAGMTSVALTGGECLLYPDFDELYAYLVESGLRLYVMTNGTLVSEHRLELFKRYKPTLIQVSLYGSTDDAYEAVTGVRVAERVLENLVRMRDAKLPVRIAITPSGYMGDDVFKLIDLAESLGIKYGVNPQLRAPRKETGRTKVDLTLEEYLSIYRYLSSIHHEELNPVDWADVPMESHGESQQYGILCGAGRSSFGIKYNGSMCPCLSLDEITAQPLEIGFKRAWKQINEAAETYPIPLECGGCVFQQDCLSCVAVHKDAPVAGHCNPMVCERMRCLVKEGFIPLRSIC